MKTPITCIGAFAVSCIVMLVIGTASAAAMTQLAFGNNLKDQAGQRGGNKNIQ
jgi:hypothetical protein